MWLHLCASGCVFEALWLCMQRPVCAWVCMVCVCVCVFAYHSALISACVNTCVCKPHVATSLVCVCLHAQGCACIYFACCARVCMLQHASPHLCVCTSLCVSVSLCTYGKSLPLVWFQPAAPDFLNCPWTFSIQFHEPQAGSTLGHIRVRGGPMEGSGFTLV